VQARPEAPQHSRNRAALQEVAMAWTSWDDVVAVAERMGYQTAVGGVVADPETGIGVPVHHSIVHPDGTLVGLIRSEDGTTWVVSADQHLESRVVRPLARAVGAFRALGALRSMGMAAQVREMADGEIQIEGVRLGDAGAEGIRGELDASGSAVFEVLGVKGPECVALVEEIARSMQAHIVERTTTSEYFTPPRRTTHAKTQVRSE
jgi:hypothetical protein